MDEASKFVVVLADLKQAVEHLYEVCVILNERVKTLEDRVDSIGEMAQRGDQAYWYNQPIGGIKF